MRSKSTKRFLVEVSADYDATDLYRSLQNLHIPANITLLCARGLNNSTLFTLSLSSPELTTLTNYKTFVSPYINRNTATNRGIAAKEES